jgi:two-component system sensor histidine kinase QseC
MTAAQKIVTNLWFDRNAEEAVNFYVSVFPDAEILSILRWGKDGQLPEGSPLLILFTLMGQQFSALNGGGKFPFTEAISLYINCETQDEIDFYWEKLLAGGGQEVQCGWLKDKFGLCWQVAPVRILDMLQDPDKDRAARVMAAMMKMIKLDIATLQAAYDKP